MDPDHGRQSATQNVCVGGGYLYWVCLCGRLKDKFTEISRVKNKQILVNGILIKSVIKIILL